MYGRGSEVLLGQNKSRHIENFAYATEQEQQKPYLFAFPGKTENIYDSTEKKPEPRHIIRKRKGHQEFPWQFVV